MNSDSVEEGFGSDTNVAPIQFLFQNFDRSLIAQTPELNLSGCDLVKLPRGLIHFENLLELNVSRNRLARLPSHLFLKYTPRLKYLNASYNLLYKFEDIKVLGRMKNLETLDVRENPLPYLANRAVFLEQLVIRSNARIFLSGKDVSVARRPGGSSLARASSEDGGVGEKTPRASRTPKAPRSSTRVRLGASPRRGGGGGDGPSSGSRSALSSPFADQSAVRRAQMRRAAAVVTGPSAGPGGKRGSGRQRDANGEEDDHKSALTKFLRESRLLDLNLNESMPADKLKAILSPEGRAGEVVTAEGGSGAGKESKDKKTKKKPGSNLADETKLRVPFIFSTQTQGRMVYFGVNPGADSPIKIQGVLQNKLTAGEHYLDMNPGRLPQVDRFAALKEVNGHVITVDDLDLALANVVDDRTADDMLVAVPVDLGLQRQLGRAAHDAAHRRGKGPKVSSVIRERQLAERRLKKEEERTQQLAAKMKRLFMEGVLPEIKTKAKDAITIEVEKELNIVDSDEERAKARATTEKQKQEGASSLASSPSPPHSPAHFSKDVAVDSDGEEQDTAQEEGLGNHSEGGVQRKKPRPLVLETGDMGAGDALHSELRSRLTDEERLRKDFRSYPVGVDKVLLELSPNPLAREMRMLSKNESHVFSRSLFKELDLDAGTSSSDDDEEEEEDKEVQKKKSDADLLGTADIIGGATYIYPHPEDETTVVDTKMELNRTRRLVVDSDRLLQEGKDGGGSGDASGANEEEEEEEDEEADDDDETQEEGELAADAASTLPGRDDLVSKTPTALLPVLAPFQEEKGKDKSEAGSRSPSPGAVPRAGHISRSRGSSPPQGTPPRFSTPKPRRSRPLVAPPRILPTTPQGKESQHQLSTSAPRNVLNMPGVDFDAFSSLPSYGESVTRVKLAHPPKLDFASVLRDQYLSQRQYNSEMVYEMKEIQKRRPASVVGAIDSIRAQKRAKARRTGERARAEFDKIIKKEIVKDKVAKAEWLGRDESIVFMRSQLADDAKRIDASKAAERRAGHLRNLHAIQDYGGKVYLEKKLTGGELAWIKAQRRGMRMDERLRDEERRREAARLRNELLKTKIEDGESSDEDFRGALRAVRERERKAAAEKMKAEEKRKAEDIAHAGEEDESYARWREDGKLRAGITPQERAAFLAERDAAIRASYAVETVDDALKDTKTTKHSVQDVILETAKIRQKMGKNLDRLAKAGDKFINDELAYETLRSDPAYVMEQYLNKSVLDKDEVLVGDTFMKYSNVYAKMRDKGNESAPDASRSGGSRHGSPTAYTRTPKRAFEIPDFPPTPASLWGTADPLAGKTPEQVARIQSQQIAERQERAQQMLQQEFADKNKRRAERFAAKLDRFARDTARAEES